MTDEEVNKIIAEFMGLEDILERNGHTKNIVLRCAVEAYIKKFKDDTFFQEYINEINYPDPKK